MIVTNKKIKWFSPITEKFSSEKINEGNSKIDLTIKGTAITSTTTRNGITYLAEELKKAVESFKDKPLLKDHENKIDNIVGRTTNNIRWDDGVNGITFEARVMDEKIKEMINDGRITSVSIGAIVKQLEKIETEENTSYIARGIEGLELSLVATPGDANASISQGFLLGESFGNAIENLFKENKEDKSKMVEEKTSEVKTEVKEEVATQPEVSTEKKESPKDAKDEKCKDDMPMDEKEVDGEDDTDSEEEPVPPKLKKKTKKVTTEEEEYEKLKNELLKIKEELKQKDVILMQAKELQLKSTKEKYIKACEKIGVKAKDNLSLEVMENMIEASKEAKVKEDATKGLIANNKEEVAESMKDYIFVKENGKLTLWKNPESRLRTKRGGQ